MEEKKSLIISQANEITRSRQKFSVIEKRLLYLIIEHVRNNDVAAEMDIFRPNIQDLVIPIKNTELHKAGDNITVVYNALKKMQSRQIEIGKIDDENYLLISWVLKVKKIKNMYYVTVAGELLPYFIQLSKEFTSYDMVVALTLKSSYSQRMYEYCSQYKNRTNSTFFLSVDDMRYEMNLGLKYSNSNDFKRYILNTAQAELKQLFDVGQCDLYFDYKVKDVDGKRELSYTFQIYTKKSIEQENNLRVELINNSAHFSRYIEELYPRDKKFVKRVAAALPRHPQAVEILNKMWEIITDNEFTKTDRTKLIRWKLKKDYGII